MQTVNYSLHNLWTIFKHEFRLFFISPVIYLIGGVWLFFAGFFFSNALGFFNQGQGEPTMAPVFVPMAFLMMFFAPAFTMRLVSEEIHSGTHELLFTSPVRDWEIVVAKWLAAWGVITVLILITALFPALLLWRGNPDPGLIIAGYLGFWLWCGTAIAIGVFASSLTQYQLVALLIGEGIALVLFLANLFSRSTIFGGSIWGDILTELTLSTHLQNSIFDRGIIEAKSFVYFFGLMSIALFLATQVLGTRRWRG
jgi:gliding motility-associated transport system permease protein